MKIFSRQSPSWLSKIVQTEIQQRYPQLAPPAFAQRIRERLNEFVPVTTLFIVIVTFLVGLGLNEFCVSRGWILATYSLAPESTADILASSLEYMAALVGIVIPVVLLIVEFVGREASSVIDVYLDEIGVKRTAVLALFVLGLEALAMWIVRSSIVSHPETLFYATYLLVLLNLSVILETGRTIWQVRKSVRSDFLVRALVTKLTDEVRGSQRREARYRLSRLAHVNLCANLNLKRTLSLSQPQDTVAIHSSASGVIQDVHLPSLIQFAEGLQTEVAEQSTRAYITKLVGDFVSEGEVLAYVSAKEQDHIEELRRALARSLKIKEPSGEGSEINRLLTQVKQMAESAAREQDEALFDELLGVYLRIFALGIGLPVPPSVELLPGLFRGWNVTATAVFHMRDLIEVAAMSKSHRFVSALADEISEVTEAMIVHSVSSIDESLQDVLHLFVTLYFFSHECENEYGMEQSFRHLTEELVDRVWTLSLRSAKGDLQAVKNLQRILGLILGTLTKLLQAMIRQYDVKNIRALLQRMHPDELLAGFHLVGSVSQQRFTLLQELRYLPESECKEKKAQLAALELIERVPQDVADFFAELVFVAASYVVEGYDSDEIDALRLKQLLQVMTPHFVPFEKSLTLLSKLVKGPSFLSWTSFHRHPDTKRAFWADEEGKYYLFYCLRGIEILAKGQSPDKLPAVDLQYQLSRIEKTCDQIAASADKWTGILSLTSSELSQRAKEFVTLNRQIAERWQWERENQIIGADLDADKVASFTESVREAFETHFGMRRFLEHHGKVMECADLPETIMWGRFGPIQVKEYFTAFYEDVESVKQLGLQYGFRLVGAEDYQIVSKWMAEGKSLRARKDWRTLGPYLERALARFEETGHRASLILAPLNLRYEVFSRTPQFVNRYDVDDEDIPELRRFDIRGFYKGIPIVQWSFDQDSPYILVIDLEKASQLEVEKPKIEMGLLSESDREQILKRNPDRTERELRLSVTIKVAEKARLTLLDKDAVLKLKLKLSRDAFMHLEEPLPDTT